MLHTHLLIFAGVDELCESLNQLLLIQPLRENNINSIRYSKASIYLKRKVTNISRAYMEDLLPQGGRLHTTDEAKQQVHHGRGIYMFQHQTNETFLFL